MNQNLYRTVFSKALAMLVPVAECARARGKSAGRTRGTSPAGIPGGLCAIASAVAAVLWSVPALATPPLPTGGAITSGAGTITQNGTTLTINQATDKLAAQWQGFDIAAGHRVVFNQPGRSSVALNRVIGPDASRIYGSLSANGHVFLVNPNGVLFAPGAQVNVGGLAASTLDISDQDFASGRYRFTRGAGAGSVVNQGQVTAGSVVLIGPKVVNSGTISTPGGRTTLAAGDQVTVSMLDGLLTAQVDASVANAEIQNHGRILADGGQVSLLAGRADSVLNSLINTDGVIRASSLREESGRIFLDAGAGGTVTVSGTVDAAGTQAGARGGAITALGKHVGLMAGADVDASGDAGGGTVLVGGNWQGTGPEHHARATYMDRTATIRADATGHGDGGKVVLWSDEYTGFYGNVSARGGSHGGTGGKVETSSHDTLQALGAVDASAAHGAAGQWLLDPLNVNITNATANGSQAGGVFTPTASPATIDVAAINSALNAGTSVTVGTGSTGAEAGNITVSSAIAKTAGADTSLTLNAAGSIAVNADISSTSGQLATTLNANGGAVSGTGNINTNGGLLTINAASGSGTLSGVISGSGGVTKAGAGTLVLSGASTFTGALNIRNGTTNSNTPSVLLAPTGSIATTTVNIGSASAGATANTYAVLQNQAANQMPNATVTFDGAPGRWAYWQLLGTQQSVVGIVDSSFNGVIENTETQTGFGNSTITLTGGGNYSYNGYFRNSAGGTGTIALTKAGAGTQTLVSNNVTYTGATAVDAGTLQIGNGGSVGVLSGSSAVSIAGGATMVWNDANFNNANRIIANSISGAGTLLLQGQNSATALQTSVYDLTGNNSGFTGTLKLDRSILWNTTAQSEVGSATIDVGDRATVAFNGGTFSNNIIIGNGAGWHHNAGGDVVLGAIRLEGNNTLSGNILLNNTTGVALGDNTGANSVIGSYTGGTQTLSGVISGSGDFSMSRFTGWNGGSGATVNIVVTGNQSNTYTGKTVVDGQLALATLTLAKTGGAVAIAPGTTVQMGSNTNGQANLRMSADNQFGAGVTMSFVNPSGQWMRFDLLGTNQSLASINAGTLTTLAGAVIQDGGWGLGASTNGTLTLTGAANYVYNGLMRDWDNVNSGGRLNVVKAGTGTQTLAGNNLSYMGTTAVNSGSLVLYNGGNFNSATTVNTGTTLEIGGTQNEDARANFSLILNDGSTLNKTNTGFDTFNNSNVTINGTVAINISNSGANNQLFIGGASTGLQGSGTINLTNTGSATTGLALRTGGGNFTGAINVNGGALNVESGASLALQNTDVNLTGTANLNLAGAFGGGASPASVKTLSGASTSTVALGGQMLTVGANNGTGADFAGVISGTGGLTKTGSGTQTLSGNNTYTGATTISGGTLRIGNGGATGSLGTGAVTNNASLVFDRANTLAVANTIGGSGSLTHAGAGTVVLTGNNTYSGTTTVAQGTLQVGNNGTTGRLGTGAVTNDGNLVLNRSDSTSLGVLAAGGITGTGNVTALIGGTFNVDRGIALTGANSTILLEAGKSQPAGTAAGGNVTLTSAISTSAGGTITIFSGNATTAAYEAMVGGASGATRYKTYNANAAATGAAVAGTRNYYYRQAPAALSVGGLTATKVYDGLRDVATVDASAAVVSGLIDGDTLAPGALNVTGARFDNAHAGARTLTATMSSGAGPSYSGGGATWSVSGYSTTGMAGSGSGTVTPRAVTANINAVGKTYDGQTSTTSTLGLPTGFAGNDGATGVSGLQLAFDNPNAGVRNVVANGTGALTGFTGGARGDGSGIGAGNEVAGLSGDYVFVAPAPAAATISQAPLTVRANNDAKIVTQADTAGYNGVSFSGFVNGEGVAALGGALNITRAGAGVDEGAGTYAGALAAGGYTSGNYAITYVPGNYRILPAQQLLVRIQNVTNTYGAATGYTVTSAQYLGVDGVTFHNLTQTANSGNTYTYADGAGGSVTFTVTPQDALNSSGGHLVVGNYGLAGSSVTIGGSNFNSLHYVGDQTVNRAALTPQPGGVSKVYDGTIAMAGLALGLGGLQAGDAVSASGTGAFASRNAGTNLTYYVDGLALSGADAANYYLASGGSLTGTDGTITPRAITVTAVPATKVYDGTTAASGTPLVNGSLVGGDSFTLLGQQFASPNVGTNIRLIPTALIEDGNGGANYLLTFVESPLGQILALPAPEQPAPRLDTSLPSQAPVAAALHRGDGAGDESQARQSRETVEDPSRQRVQVISTGLKLPQGLGASPLDDFQQGAK